MSAGASPAVRSASAILIALALVGLGLFLLVQAYTMALEQSAYARVGPQVFPAIFGAALIVVGALLAREALKRTWTVTWAESEEGSRAGALRQMGDVALVGIGLIVNAALIAPLGFVFASTVMFALTTRAFGSRRVLFDLAVGLAFSGFIFVCFTYLLRLPLPAGTFWGGR